VSRFALEIAGERNLRIENGLPSAIFLGWGSDVELYGMGVAVCRLQQRRLPRHFRLLRPRAASSTTPAKASSPTSRKKPASSTSRASAPRPLVRLRPRRPPRSFVCNYVRWSDDTISLCSLDGKINPTASRSLSRATPAGFFTIVVTAPSKTSPPPAHLRH